MDRASVYNKREMPMKNKIIMDSSGDLHVFEGVDFASVPLKITAGEREFVDDASMNVEEMVRYLKSYKGKAITACPGVGDYLEAFGDAENVYCITITSGLSGSYNAAMVAARTWKEQHPEGHVHVFDSLTAGPEMTLLAEKLRELISEKLSFESIVQKMKNYQQKTRLMFSLESLHNLANNGRVSVAVAAVAGMLGIRLVGRASTEGTLEPISKVRGEKKLVPELVRQIADMGYNGGKVLISHCFNPETAAKLKEAITEKFPSAVIRIGKTGGLCSFYAEQGGLLIGFEVK